MADYAGAVAALRAAFEAGWNETDVEYQNEKPPRSPWPPTDTEAPWAYFEVIQGAAALRGVGSPAQRLYQDSGYVLIHIFAPVGYGLPESLRLADVAGEIFRGKTFYNDGTNKVVCFAPMVGGGAMPADVAGNWYGVTTRIPFEFFYFK